MNRAILIGLLACSLGAAAEERTETREFTGVLGSRNAILVLHSTQRADGGWQMAGEYIVLPTMHRRFVEGERGPELGVTLLKEGTTAILFGRPATGELRGTLRDGVFKGLRFGPGGQERERFEFTEQFASMEGYSASVRCEASAARYDASLSYVVEAGRIKAFEWVSKVAPSGQRCVLKAPVQQPLKGGLAASSGECAVKLRDLGDYVKVSAEHCAAQCAPEAWLEPLLVDRRGNCALLRPDPR